MRTKNKDGVDNSAPSFPQVEVPYDFGLGCEVCGLEGCFVFGSVRLDGPLLPLSPPFSRPPLSGRFLSELRLEVMYCLLFGNLV